MVTAVVVNDVWKYYGVTPALRGVSLCVEDGEFVAVMGPSGSGKSTLLALIAGLDRPSKGYVEVFGERISGWSPGRRALWRRRNVGIVFQFYYLIPELTVLENVVLPMKLAGIHRGREKERALELLEAVGLRDKAHRLPGELSGGEQQRVALARALANEPKLLIADEPTASLDTENKKVVASLISELAGDRTVILATHEEWLANMADRVVRLVDGRITSGAERGG